MAKHQILEFLLWATIIKKWYSMPLAALDLAPWFSLIRSLPSNSGLAVIWHFTGAQSWAPAVCHLKQHHGSWFALCTVRHRGKWTLRAGQNTSKSWNYGGLAPHYCWSGEFRLCRWLPPAVISFQFCFGYLWSSLVLTWNPKDSICTQSQGYCTYPNSCHSTISKDASDACCRGHSIMVNQPVFWASLDS